MKQKRLIIALLCISVIWLISVTMYLSNRPQIPKMPLLCPEINLVYTWVDGSDPAHIEARIQRAGNRKWAAPGNNRFRDLGGLKYSLRSVEAYAPWIKKIFIVTSGQIPPFLNLDDPQIELVFHEQIFDNKEDLPTFNSNAIEGNFHNLPDEVGPCFIYLNDDMFFANNVKPTDFYREDTGQILFTSSWTAPPSKDKLNNIWHRSVMNSNKILDELWGEDRRNYASHGPYFFSLEVLRHMYNTIPSLFNLTSTHPFRHESDAAVPFLYNQWAEHYYTVTIAGATINHYMKISDDAKKAKKDFQRIIDRRPKTVCLNDALDEDSPNQLSLQYMNEFFEKLFPKRSKYEKEEL
eukprot:Phypoly_transcript_08747.p1 GENE.Phypoly_transcript_08747~~Phypoly_transcript_08747.p1  ORF type:complete len:351 (+),score=51.99 Phypoly_transcript_08747:189-1241(+)